MATGGTAVREGFFKPRLLVQARLGIGGPRQLTRQVEATQVFDTALGRHGATNPPGDPVRHLAPGPQPAVRRRLADHVAQLLHLGLVEQRGGTGIVQPAVAQTRKAVVVVAPQDLADPDRRIARDLRHELRRMSLAQQPDDLKVTALNAAIRCLVAPLQLLGRVMWSEKNSTGHADDVATENGHNTPQSIAQTIFLQITEAKASIRKAYNTKKPRVERSKVLSLMSAEKGHNHDLLQFCNGHDVARIVGIALREIIGERR